MLILNLEALPGDDIRATAVEMCGAGERFDLAVSVKFNDVSLTAMVGAHPEDVVNGYHDEMRGSHPHKVVVVHPPK